MAIPQRHAFERARKATLARSLEDQRAAEAQEYDDMDIQPANTPRLAHARLYQHRAFRLMSAEELVPAVLERAECNGTDALDSDDPVNALCDVGWEADCWLEPDGNGGSAGHLDSLLIELIRDVRRLKREGRENEAEHEAYMRVQQLGTRLIDWMKHSASPQKVALDELLEEHQDRVEIALMTAAGV
ncbi:hypothetical protein [Thiohalocapsa marina]|uniref:hypothetical protein n=1 Tax=Thiohalocapsa marina TaxID=424902 RepID=UPI0036D8BD6F